MPSRFVSEPIAPAPDALDASTSMGQGAPGLPMRFTWRGREVAVAEVLEKWKETGSCKSGSSERYLRKHWFRVRTQDGEEMRIYFERQPRSARERKTRWWLYSISTEAGENRPDDSPPAP